MNGRMYDPAIGQMLSPDNYIQNPNNTQNYNRYSYCLNNPLKYTDPSGEFLQAPFYLLALLGGYASNSLNGYDHPWALAKENATETTNGINNCMQYPLYQDDETVFTVGVSPFSMGVSANLYHKEGDFSFAGSVGFGLTGGMANAGVSYSANGLDIGASIGGGKNNWGWKGSAEYDGWGGGYGRTYYGDAIGPDGQSNSQTTGSYSFFFNHNSFRWENDNFSKSGDKWRTNAMEIQIGDFVIGSSIYTNDGLTASGGEGGTVNLPSRRWSFNKSPDHDAWIDGKVYSSPIWIGYKTGNSIARIGYSNSKFQDYQQNWIHQAGWPLRSINQNYYLDYSQFKSGPWNYIGYYNPYSLY